MSTIEAAERAVTLAEREAAAATALHTERRDKFQRATEEGIAARKAMHRYAPNSVEYAQHASDAAKLEQMAADLLGYCKAPALEQAAALAALEVARGSLVAAKQAAAREDLEAVCARAQEMITSLQPQLAELAAAANALRASAGQVPAALPEFAFLKYDARWPLAWVVGGKR